MKPCPLPFLLFVLHAVGAFSISWTSVASSRSNGALDSKTMVVVLSCVSAAGALLAACCFYFVCCGRRRRAGVSGGGAGLSRKGLAEGNTCGFAESAAPKHREGRDSVF